MVSVVYAARPHRHHSGRSCGFCALCRIICEGFRGPARRGGIRGPARRGGIRGPARRGGIRGPARRGGIRGPARRGGIRGPARRGGIRGPARRGGIRGPARRGGIRGPARRGGIRGPARRGGIRGPARRGGIRGPARRGGIRGPARRGGIRGPARRGGIRGPARRGGIRGPARALGCFLLLPACTDAAVNAAVHAAPDDAADLTLPNCCGILLVRLQISCSCTGTAPFLRRLRRARLGIATETRPCNFAAPACGVLSAYFRFICHPLPPFLLPSPSPSRYLPAALALGSAPSLPPPPPVACAGRLDPDQR